MAQACACDRCGKFYVVKGDRRRSDSRYIVLDQENFNGAYCDHHMDLCDDCYKGLEEFMNESRNSQTI